jgi:adenylate cyclase
MLYPGMEDLVQPGQRFESIVRVAAEKGLIPAAESRIDEWVAERVSQHRRSAGTTIQQRGDGFWVEIRETRTEDGDSVAIYTDITERRNFELRLQEEKRRTEEANTW